MNIQASRICLVHYHEIGLKGHNRVNFENRLIKNIKSLIDKESYLEIRRISGRICILFKQDCSPSRTLECMHSLRDVPGVARVSCGYRCERDIDIMREVACMTLEECDDFYTFKVSARRSHTDFPINSMEINQIIGSILCQRFPDKKVKMQSPDVCVHVEVIQGFSYIFAHSIPGIGGLPVGSSGRVVCLLSSGIDSPVALWRMARRGAICIGVHFSGRPQTDSSSEYLVDDIAHVLQKSGCISKVYTVAFGDYQKQIALSAPPELRVILYRRLMCKVAERIACLEHAKALVTGESLGQVASQTIDNLIATDDATSMLIFRPLIGTDKLEIINEAQRLGTFDISSEDASDCCTLFMPRNPETHARLEKVREAESAFPVDRWVEELVNDATCTSYR